MSASSPPFSPKSLDNTCISEESSTLPWDRFSNWIHCICIVTFDLEVGQAIEVRLRVRVTVSLKTSQSVTD